MCTTRTSFARWALDKFGIELPKLADEDLVLGYAMYQTIRLFPGTYDSGPGAPAVRLTAIYTDGISGADESKKPPRSIEELDDTELPRESGVVFEQRGGALKTEKRWHAIEGGVAFIEWAEFAEGRWICTGSFSLSTEAYDKLLRLTGAKEW